MVYQSIEGLIQSLDRVVVCLSSYSCVGPRDWDLDATADASSRAVLPNPVHVLDLGLGSEPQTLIPDAFLILVPAP